jgi:hypothetical protein
MPLEPENERYVVAAMGYCELNMWTDADEELDKVDPELRHLPEVLEVRMEIYRGAQKWPLMLEIARHLAKYDPSNAGWVADYAFAARRAVSIEHAREILRDAVKRDSTPGIFHFNLACYEAQLGNVPQAKKHLSAAIERDAKYKNLALEDPDLEPLW